MQAMPRKPVDRLTEEGARKGSPPRFGEGTKPASALVRLHIMDMAFGLPSTFWIPCGSLRPDPPRL